MRPRPSIQKLAEDCNVSQSTLEHWFSQGTRLLYIIAAGKVEFKVLLVQLINFCLGTPYILIALAALDMKNDIINRKFTTVQDISSVGFKLRDPQGECILESLRTELRAFLDDGLGNLIKTVIIPHLQDIERLAPGGLSLSFMKGAVDKLELLPFSQVDEFDMKLDRADIK